MYATFLQSDPVLKFPPKTAQLPNVYISSRQLPVALNKFSLMKVAFMMMLFPSFFQNWSRSEAAQKIERDAKKRNLLLLYLYIYKVVISVLMYVLIFTFP